MNKFTRALLIILIPAFLWVSFTSGNIRIFGIIGFGLFVFVFIFYSGRKQRVRYWMQGYRRYREGMGVDDLSAIKLTQKEFCASKYAENHICSNSYQNIEELVEDIIKKEFKFEKIVQSRVLSPDDHRRNLLAYKKETENLRQEIEDIKKEVLRT